MTQETHKSLKLAFALKDRSRLGHETEQAAKLRRIKACDEAATEIRYMHALIVQMAHVFEGEHFEHDDQRKAVAACTQYLKAKP